MEKRDIRNQLIPKLKIQRKFLTIFLLFLKILGERPSLSFYSVSHSSTS